MRTRILNTIFNWCRRHDRYRLILDRDGQTPYLERYYLLFRNRPRWFPFNIVLHKILLSDLEDLHDHPWPYATILLKNGYWETTPRGKFWRGAGWATIRPATALHRLELADGMPCWSLFFMGKRCREWGFIRDGEWVEAEQYISDREAHNTAINDHLS